MSNPKTHHLPIAPQEIMASEIYKEFEAKLREFLCLCIGGGGGGGGGGINRHVCMGANAYVL